MGDRMTRIASVKTDCFQGGNAANRVGPFYNDPSFKSTSECPLSLIIRLWLTLDMRSKSYSGGHHISPCAEYCSERGPNNLIFFSLSTREHLSAQAKERKRRHSNQWVLLFHGSMRQDVREKESPFILELPRARHKFQHISFIYCSVSTQQPKRPRQIHLVLHMTFLASLIFLPYTMFII